MPSIPAGTKGSNIEVNALSEAMRLKIVYRKIDDLIPFVGNARTHSAKQITQIAASIRQFGFTNPILIDDHLGIIAGHGRVAAAKKLGMKLVPTVELAHLTEAERRAYIIADNRLAELAGWDETILKIEFQFLVDIELDFDLEITGFETAEIDLIIEDDAEPEIDLADEVPALSMGPPVTQPGDIWQLGKHRLICGDARNADTYTALMGSERARAVFTDPPYNVRIDGNVCGSGSVKHREFAMGVGEMDAPAFTTFLQACLGAMVKVSFDGAIHFVCMDWRHIAELQAAGSAIYSELKNLCVWAKTNGGMGTFYRSRHELIFVWKVGTAPHTNTFGLGEKGRYRTNVWEYSGVNSFGNQQRDLELHPTVKPVALVADAIRDVTRRGEIVLDGFGGSGTTLIAAERCGRQARLIELDPHYCDVICRRYQALTGKDALLVETGESFTTLSEHRSTLSPSPELETENG